MSENADSSGLPTTGTPPEDKGEAGKSKVRMLTEDEAKELADRKLRGVLKERDKDQRRLAELEAAEEKRKQEKLSESERAAKAEARAAEVEKLLRAREEADAAELAEIDEENKESAKQLKKLAPFVVIPEGLPPKTLAKWLRKQAAQVSTETIGVHGGSGRGAAPLTDEQKRKAHDDDLVAKGSAFLFGKDKK